LPAVHTSYLRFHPSRLNRQRASRDRVAPRTGAFPSKSVEKRDNVRAKCSQNSSFDPRVVCDLHRRSRRLDDSIIAFSAAVASRVATLFEYLKNCCKLPQRSRPRRVTSLSKTLTKSARDLNRAGGWRGASIRECNTLATSAGFLRSRIIPPRVTTRVRSDLNASEESFNRTRWILAYLNTDARQVPLSDRADLPENVPIKRVYVENPKAST